jgi:hypothetical protein
MKPAMSRRPMMMMLPPMMMLPTFLSRATVPFGAGAIRLDGLVAAQELRMMLLATQPTLPSAHADTRNTGS